MDTTHAATTSQIRRSNIGTIDAQAVPDIHSPGWKGNRGYATSDVMVAPPNAKRVR